jgi:hypothetical protein
MVLETMRIAVNSLPRACSGILDIRAGSDHTFVSEWRPPDQWSYAYLLGLYLGDGCLGRPARTYQLSITLDDAYPGIIEDAVAAIELTLLPRRAGRIARYRPRGSRCVRLVSSCHRWPEAFPQHGRGRKHERPIVLEPWQKEIVDRHADAFVRGLIHSDGCRTVNRFSTTLPSGRVAEYAYPRYFFSNLSADIRELFCTACDRLGVRWTKSNPRNVSVSHRASVAILDQHVGPKA